MGWRPTFFEGCEFYCPLIAKNKRERAAAVIAKAVKDGMEQKCLLSQMELATEEAKRQLGQEQMDQTSPGNAFGRCGA